MAIITVPATPFPGQKPGTSGLRKKTAVFRTPGFLENFVQCVFDMTRAEGKTIIVGGDGRFFNDRAIQTIVKMAAANGVAEVKVALNGILSTPAASHLVRKTGSDLAIVLSASHNPGGEDGDFGIKFNLENGGPAPERVTDAVYGATQRIASYKISDCPDIDISAAGVTAMENTRVSVFDAVTDYVELMDRIFGFGKLSELFASGFTFRFDAMNAVTGPYAKAIFEGALGAKPGTVLNAEPKEDFGNRHPDPNPANCEALVSFMASPGAADMAAAADGDGDRNMIIGKGLCVSPSDSLAVLLAQSSHIPYYAGRVSGVARSMPTSSAVDLVASSMGIPCFETPTGWKFFGNLLDAGRITFCGEESYGTSSDHVREKDGLWAVLCWLSVVSATGLSVTELVKNHWKQYGRHYYARHDYEGVPEEAASKMMETLAVKLSAMEGTTYAGRKVMTAGTFSYADPVDRSVSGNQGLRIVFEGGSRIVFRLSGTGTSGATVRVYFERYEKDDTGLDTDEALAWLYGAAEDLAGLKQATGFAGPTHTT